MTVACVSDTKTNQYSDKICYYVADVSAIVWQVWEWVRVWVRESVGRKIYQSRKENHLLDAFSIQSRVFILMTYFPACQS